jgi:hypothetical protein
VYERGQKKCVKSTPSSDLFLQLFQTKNKKQQPKQKNALENAAGG